MKKAISTITIISLLLLTAFSIPVRADFTDGYTYNYGPLTFIYSGNISISGCDPQATEVSIPSFINGYPVVSIEAEAFMNCTKLKSIIIPETVSSIGRAAFQNCTALTDINIPKNVTSIGSSLFWNCKSLSNITIHSDIHYIDETAFLSCDSLSNIAVDRNNYYYYSENGNLYNKDKTHLIKYAGGKTDPFYELPANISWVSEIAFTECHNLTAITVNEGSDYYSSLDGHLFNKDQTVFIRYASGKRESSYEIPSSVNTIGTYAFSNSNLLKDIIIPNSVTDILACAFIGCNFLTDVNLHDNINFIGTSAFSGCSSLVDVTIPKNLIHLPVGAFHDCSSLINVFIPKGMETIDVMAFSGCTNLTTVNYSGTQESWDNIAIRVGNTSLTSANIICNYTNTGKIKLLYNANGGQNAPTATECETSEETTISSLVPTRGSCTFLGWSTSSSATSAQYQPNDTITIGTSDITLYAVWELIPYTINNLTITDLSGNALSEIPEGNFYLEIDVTKNDNSPNADSLIIAVYDENDAFLNLSFMKGTYTQNQSVTFGTMINKPDKKIGSIKAFVWGSLFTANPLSNVVEIN